MSELCLDCYNKMFGKNLTEHDVTLEPDICEGCGEYKDCVLDIRNKPWYNKFVKIGGNHLLRPPKIEKREPMS